MASSNKYESLSDIKKSEIVKGIYENRKATKTYSTSRDFHLRELEIDFIIKSIERLGKKRPKILDIGCGNGYTDICIAQKLDCYIIGVDFSHNMIKAAKYNLAKNGKSLKGQIIFMVSDILNLEYENINAEYYDIVITERLLLNLPSKDRQFETIDKIHRTLKQGGLYLMIEGSKDGLKKLNSIRVKLGLKEIEDRSDNNLSSLKFDERELNIKLKPLFSIISHKYWSLYYLVSRVIHPMIVYPNEPKWNSELNTLAREIENLGLNKKLKIGHVKGLILRKR